MAVSIDLRQFVDVFFEETDEHLSVMEHLLLSMNRQRPEPGALDAILRAAHSIKGSAGIFGFHALTSLTHVMESLFDRLRRGDIKWRAELAAPLLDATDVLKQLRNSYRAQQQPDLTRCNDACEKLESLIAEHDSEAIPDSEEGYGFFAPSSSMPASEAYGFFDTPVPTNEQTGEPATIAAPLQEPAAASVTQVETLSEAKKRRSETATIRVNVDKIDHIINLLGELIIAQSMLQQSHAETLAFDSPQQQALKLLERHTRHLQSAVMSIRMVPIAMVFNRFPRVVHDLSTQLGKAVELEFVGEHTELDKNLVEKLSDPLTHLVRNSIDHGIEKPEQRLQQGKPAYGTIKLVAHESSGSIVITISDDGAGLNRGKILRKARSLNMNVSDSMSDKELWQLLFTPGFSTAEQITDLSGRGVGMDVVKRNITELNGRVELSSTPGQGTQTTIRLPLTLAILDGMVVAVGEQRFVIPVESIVESLQPQPGDVRAVSGQPQMINVRGQYLPLLQLHQLMNLTPQFSAPEHALIVVLEHEGQRAALQIDELCGQQQVVIKSLETHYKKVANISSATIMGDGRVALILHVEQLLARTQGGKA